MIGKLSVALLLLLAAAGPVAGEEIVAFSSTAAGPSAWKTDGLTVQATNQLLRFTLTRDGTGRAAVLPHVGAVPRALLRLFARGDAVVWVRGGSFATNLVPAGLDNPVDLPLPTDAGSWQLSVEINGSAGAMLELRELLVSGALDMDPPLLLASGRQAGPWTSLGAAEFRSDGLKVIGPVETRSHFAYSNDAVVVLSASALEGRGMRVSGVAWGKGGERLGEAVLGEVAMAGFHAFACDRVAWPQGTVAASVLLRPAAEASSAVLVDLWVGRRP